MKNCQRLIVKGQMFCAERKKGFSFVELLVVLAIVMLVTGALFTNRNSKASGEVESAARQLAAQLRSLQNESLNGKQVGSLLVPACSYEFKTTSLSTTYVLNYYSACGDVSGTPDSPQTLKFNNKDKVRVASTSPSYNFYFRSPRGELAAPTQQIILESVGQSTIKASVCVYASGNIVDKKGSSGC